MAWALPGGERVRGPLESPREIPQSWAPWLQMLPQAPALGPDVAQLGPGSPQVNVICGHQGPETLDAFIGRGLGALGDRSRTGHSPFSSSLGQILESGGRWVQV